MGEATYHPEVDEIIDALKPLASKAIVKSAHWISTPDGTYETNNGSEWCRDCGMAKLKHLRNHDRKRADRYILDGGWVSEHDTPPMCAHCCVKPAHLSVGTRSDNMKDAARKKKVTTVGQARKTTCVNGHPLSGDNLVLRANGHRRCHQCDLSRGRLLYRKKHPGCVPRV